MKRLALWIIGGSLVVVSLYGLGATQSGISAPYFPIGLYCVEDPRDFSEIAGAGFNLVQGYRFEGGYPDLYPHTLEAARSYLDAAWNSGLRVLMGLPQDAIRNRQLADVRDRVLTLQNHPALLGWQLYDEPEAPAADDEIEEAPARPVPPENMRAAYDLIKRLDAKHPVSIATAVTIDGSYPYLDTADVLMPDFFPVPFYPLEHIGIDVSAAVRVAKSRGKSVIPHVQVYNLANDPLSWPQDQPPALGRYPTRGEIRFMAYFSIIRGAEGVFFNCYRFDYGQGLGGDDISARANPSQWRAVASVAAELNSLVPILAAQLVEPQDAGVSVTGAKTIETLIKRYQGYLYLLTANASSTPADAMIRLAPDRFPGPQVDVLGETRTLSVRGSVFIDHWGPYDVRIYKIAASVPVIQRPSR